MEQSKLKKRRTYYYLDCHCQYLVTYFRSHEYAECYYVRTPRKRVIKKRMINTYIFKIKKMIYVSNINTFEVPHNSQIVLTVDQVKNKIFINSQFITNITEL